MRASRAFRVFRTLEVFRAFKTPQAYINHCRILNVSKLNIPTSFNPFKDSIQLFKSIDHFHFKESHPFQKLWVSSELQNFKSASRSPVNSRNISFNYFKWKKLQLPSILKTNLKNEPMNLQLMRLRRLPKSLAFLQSFTQWGSWPQSRYHLKDFEWG